jgi:hypothetical protein
MSRILLWYGRGRQYFFMLQIDLLYLLLKIL